MHVRLHAACGSPVCWTCMCWTKCWHPCCLQKGLLVSNFARSGSVTGAAMGTSGAGGTRWVHRARLTEAHANTPVAYITSQEYGVSHQTFITASVIRQSFVASVISHQSSVTHHSPVIRQSSSSHQSSDRHLDIRICRGISIHIRHA